MSTGPSFQRPQRAQHPSTLLDPICTYKYLGRQVRQAKMDSARRVMNRTRNSSSIAEISASARTK
jgi:hypothetical protein